MREPSNQECDRSTGAPEEFPDGEYRQFRHSDGSRDDLTQLTLTIPLTSDGRKVRAIELIP